MSAFYDEIHFDSVSRCFYLFFFLICDFFASSLLQAAVKDCKWASKQVSEMTSELAKISQISNVGPLTDKQAEMEQEKADVESSLKELMALLQEMTEEWEQCERKSKDVAGWIEKTRQALDNPQNKKRSLRDQLASREKALADVTIQKTKLVMAMEKLQVHFRDRMCAEAQVAHENELLQARLEELQATVKEDCKTLEACVHQMDAYQQVSIVNIHAGLLFLSTGVWVCGGDSESSLGTPEESACTQVLDESSSFL